MASVAGPAGFLFASSADLAYGSPASLAGATPHRFVGTRNGADAPKRSAAPSNGLPSLPRPELAPLGIDRSSPDLLATARTYARSLSRLARASVLGFARRCRLARSVALLASSLDFLQGTFEKIQFQRFLRQKPLQAVSLLAVGPFMCTRSHRLLTRFEQIQFGSPFVETSSSHAELLGQLTDVLTTLHASYRHPLKLSWISLPLHFALLSLQSVPISSVSFQGFTPFSSHPATQIHLDTAQVSPAGEMK